jgi:hypothetical protein
VNLNYLSGVCHRSNNEINTCLELTLVGRRLAKSLEPWADVVKKQLVLLEEGEQLELMTSVMSLIAALQKAGVITVARMCHTCQFLQAESGDNHFCTLLNQSLGPRDLRMDCPEHQPMVTEL